MSLCVVAVRESHLPKVSARPPADLPANFVRASFEAPFDGERDGSKGHGSGEGEGRGGEGGGEGLEEKTEGGSYLEGDVVAVPLVATVSPPRPLLDDFGQKLRHLVLSLLPLR